jgi:hypothetical protein
LGYENDEEEIGNESVTVVLRCERYVEVLGVGDRKKRDGEEERGREGVDNWE